MKNNPIREVRGSNTPAARESTLQRNVTLIRGNGFGVDVRQILKKEDKRIIVCSGYGTLSGRGYVEFPEASGAGKYKE